MTRPIKSGSELVLNPDNGPAFTLVRAAGGWVILDYADTGVLVRQYPALDTVVASHCLDLS